MLNRGDCLIEVTTWTGLTIYSKLSTSLIDRFNSINVRISENSGNQKKYVAIYYKDIQRKYDKENCHVILL